MPPKRVGFLPRFGLKMGVDFAPFGLESGPWFSKELRECMNVFYGGGTGKQNHKTLKQNRKTQNKITKLKTESQNSKQNHKTQNRNTKLKTESQNPKQNRKIQNRNKKLKTESQNSNLWEDTVRSISKTAFKQNHSLKVHFIGEEAADEGGPKRDFLRLAMTAVCNYSGVLQGLECRKTFSNNPLLLERKAYYCASLVTGMSLQQGGPGLHCLSPSLFDYFVAGPSSSRAIPLDVADHDMRKKIEKVKLADARLHELMITRT